MKLIVIDEQESEYALFLKNFYKSDTGDASHDYSRILFFEQKKTKLSTALEWPTYTTSLSPHRSVIVPAGVHSSIVPVSQYLWHMY
jgi:hypothetical protein